MKDDEKCKECGKPIRNMRFYRDKNQDEIICYDCAVLPMQPKDNKKTTCDLNICPPEDCIEDCPHYPKRIFSVCYQYKENVVYSDFGEFSIPNIGETVLFYYGETNRTKRYIVSNIINSTTENRVYVSLKA